MDKNWKQKTDFDDMKKPSRETLICVCQFRLKAFGLQGDSFLFSVSKENIRLIKNFLPWGLVSALAYRWRGVWLWFTTLTTRRIWGLETRLTWPQDPCARPLGSRAQPFQMQFELKCTSGSRCWKQNSGCLFDSMFIVHVARRRPKVFTWHCCCQLS